MARIGASGTGGANNGAAGNPAGNNTDVQFNDNGVFGGSDNFTFDGNFVYSGGFLGDNNLPNSVTLTIGPTKQLIVASPYAVFGTLIIEGTFQVL
jgi:hypothetical protein